MAFMVLTDENGNKVMMEEENSRMLFSKTEYLERLNAEIKSVEEQLIGLKWKKTEVEKIDLNVSPTA